MKTQRLIIELASKKRAMRSKEKTQKHQVRVLPAWKGKALSLVALAATCSACSGQYSGNYDLVLLGNEKGLEKLTDYSVGLVNEGKTSPDVKSAHYGLREQQTGIEGLKLKLKEMKEANHGK